MCGIFGTINVGVKYDHESRKKFLAQAFIVDSLRGEHSTGLFAVERPDVERRFKGHGVFSLKRVLAGYDFIGVKEFGHHMAALKDYSYFVGHNRYATMGALTAENAHPFAEGDITLVHNGTLRNLDALPAKPKDAPKRIETDSNLIAYNLNLHAPEVVIPTLLGSFCLVWHDKRDDTLNMVRNSQRPMHLCQAKHHDALYFMSEAEMLHLLMKRNKIDHNGIYSLDIGTWLKWKVGEMEPTEKKVPLGQIRRTTPVGKSNSGTTRNTGTTGRFRCDKVAQPQGQRRGKALISGEFKDIPDNHSSAIEALGLNSCQDYPFNPMINKPHTHGQRTIEGTVGFNDEHLAIIYGVSEDLASRSFTREWTVQCCGVGIRLDANGSKYPVVICRLRIASTTAAIANKRLAMKQEEKVKKQYNVPTLTAKDVIQGLTEADLLEGAGQSDADEDYEIPGANGRYLTKSEYKELTKHGCAQCSSDLDVWDAPDIFWVGENDDRPLCFVCGKMWESGDSSADAYDVWDKD